MQTHVQYLLYACLGACVLGLLFSFGKARWIEKQDPGNEKMVQISTWVREGAMAFLKREYLVLAIFVAVVTGFLYSANAGDLRWGAFAYPIGAGVSALTGYLGMKTATLANCRTAQAARKGICEALFVAFGGGSVMGMYVVSWGLFALTGLFLFFLGLFGCDLTAVNTLVLPVLTNYCMGASSVALFARVGGGIYTKAADVGADIAGKIVAGIPEDDPRNPGVIADNVGDNVGDVAGMGADLCESYNGAILSAMIFGAVIGIDTGNLMFAILPLVLSAVGIIVSIIGTLFVRTKEGGNPQTALNIGTFGAGALMIALSYPIIIYLIPSTFVLAGITFSAIGIFYALSVGLIGGILIGLITQYYTAENLSPVKKIALACKTGAGTNVIAGLGNGMLSTAFPTIVLGAVILVAYHFAGLYGVAIAAVGMLSTTGIQLATDAYGPIADNAGGLAEMAGLPPSVRKITDNLDAVGNSTAAIGKGFAIGSAALTALALFVAFKQAVHLETIDVSNPVVMVGLLIGSMLPFLFAAFSMSAVGEAACAIAEEVARQFRDIKGLLEGVPGVYADNTKCVDIAAREAIKRMMAPALIAIATPVFVGFVGGPEMLAGVLVGTTGTGVMMALFMANAGGSWDNAKKHIEGGGLGAENGKGSDVHKAAVTGDTVGDPFKDTAGPSLNILIKLISMVALVIAPMLI
ncbi:MAG: sodium-translocating pyrophosphatase [Candidatus Paceibacterota bacterium]|jgi:K(+)-stimulated pyrophosphate-energized sodium pump